MNTPGSTLKAERKKQKRSLEEIAKKLKIKIEYLKAIEDDNYQLLPAEVFTKAYMRLYAEALNIKSDHLLSLYKDESTAAAPVETVIEPKKRKVNFRPFLIVMVLLLIAGLTFYLTKYEAQETVQVIAEETVEVKEPVETEEIVAPAIIEKVEAIEKMTVEFVATELTWVSISIDEAKPEEWLLRTGDSKTLNASKGFVIKVGNAGGTKLLFNGQDIGALGHHGKVVDIVLP